ncbi:ABC transporter ATP-binding protein [Nonomuraea sp. WAC 01424]|uniref:ATP-binding cassette domain-containing protein n=1 Tax=Nonomuraea sp. WAC 01424 TaxID=2203200 RepID=UPI000F77399F|nr:ABC transporter ATP-binding protein [Nonomuraea sp. WAC 01424]RSN15306.1 ABC transporter ATP-binding protein [Nonomuraea sp. WAC 01424]
MTGPSLTRHRRAARGRPAPDGSTPCTQATASGRGLLLTLLRRRRRPLVMATAWSLVEAGPAWLSGLLIAQAIDQGFLTGSAGTGLAWLALLGLAMLGKAVATRLMFPHLAAVVEPLRDDLVRAVVTAAVTRAARTAEPPDAAAATRLTEQVDTLRNLVSALLRSSRALGIALIAALGGLLALSPLVAAMTAGPVLVALAVFARLLPVLMARQRELILADEALTARATPILTGLRDIAACGAGSQAYADVEPTVTAQAVAARALARAALGRRLVVALGAHVPLLGLLIVARPLIQDGRLSAGEVVGAVTYLATGLDPAMRALVGTVGGWGVALAVTARRIAETVTVPDVPVPPGGHLFPNGHELRAERLSFAYAPQATPVVRDLDLTIREGEHLTLVGPSGIGKSTLSMLLTGLRRPTGGEIRLGGVPLASIAEHEARTMMALVPQEAYVFSGTVRENLAYLVPDDTENDTENDAENDAEDDASDDARDERLREAAERVGAGPLLERLGGLDAVIAEPSALSAGEKQLVALARTYASPARLVVLDEATCNLDPVAEARAELAFAARPGTLIVIAHRISSARRARRIVLMDGTAVLTGSHDDLMVSSPLYADMVGRWQPEGST